MNVGETADVPLAYDVDVVVAGAGISGAFAALGAAGQGARVVLVDRFGEPGGNLGPGIIVGGIWGDGEWQIKWEIDNAFMLSLPGTVAQFFQRLESSLDDMPRNYGTLSNGMSRVFFEMFAEAGVELILSAYVADPILEDGRVRGLYVETKSGRIAVRSGVVVDSTGEADVARLAELGLRSG
jgi:flavin-dependent dehydrogenase